MVGKQVDNRLAKVSYSAMLKMKYVTLEMVIYILFGNAKNEVRDSSTKS